MVLRNVFFVLDLYGFDQPLFHFQEEIKVSGVTFNVLTYLFEKNKLKL